MIKQLREWWAARAPRERLVVLVLGAVLGVALYVVWVQSATQARAQLGQRVTALRAEAAQVDEQAREIERLRSAPPPAVSQTDLRSLLQARANAAGLDRALTRLDVQDPAHVQVTFGAVPFAGWLDWVAGLQAQKVRLETARIEALSTPGLVSVSATFTRPMPR
jgi:general secretion pathway protein M